MRNNPFLFWLLFFADGVFGADGVKSVSVSVMVGDSVILHTDESETRGALELVWKIQGENKFIAEIDKEINKLSVPGNDEERFRGRLKLDDQTGSLTITNLNTTDSRVYELQIKNSRETKSKIFNVDVRDEMKAVLVKKEESITLRTGTTDILGYDLILWNFEDHLLAKINRTATQFSLYDNAGGRFKGRLQLHHQTGSLIISDTRTTDSGDYQLNMNSNSHSLERTYSVTVKGLSSIVIAVISVSVALVVAVALMIYCWCRSRKR